jgi:hypothetical protein
MKWKTAFKEALAFNIVKNFFDAADPGLISEAGMKELRKQKLIKMMEQDQEAGLYDVNFNSTIEQPPSMRIFTLPKYVGCYCLGGKNGFCISFEKKPNWFHRTMMKACLGWEWTDKK